MFGETARRLNAVLSANAGNVELDTQQIAKCRVLAEPGHGKPLLLEPGRHALIDAALDG